MGGKFLFAPLLPPLSFLNNHCSITPTTMPPPPQESSPSTPDPDAPAPYLDFANNITSSLNNALNTTFLESLRETLAEAQRVSEQDAHKIQQLMVDQADANTYLQKKLDDNYQAIQRLEDRITSSQEERREAEISMINEMNSLKEKHTVELERMKIEISEKERDYAILLEFVDGREEKKDKMSKLQAQLEEQRASHQEVQANLLAKQERERAALRNSCREKMTTTENNMMLIASESLHLQTRRIMMEAEKMKNEVVYQEREMRKLEKSTFQRAEEARLLEIERKEGAKNEEDSAKKAYMYAKIISKLKGKIKEKEEEIDMARKDKEANAHNPQHLPVKEKLDLRVREIIDEIKAIRNAEEEIRLREKDAQVRTELIQKCQGKMVRWMVRGMRKIFPNYNEGKSDEEDGDRSGEEGLRDDFGEDLISDDDSFTGGASLTSRNLEQEIIDQTLDKELQAYLGLAGDEEEETNDEPWKEGDGNQLDNAPNYSYGRPAQNDGSVKGLDINVRTKQLRRLLAMMHNFQLQEDGGGGLEEGLGEKEHVRGLTLPAIDNKDGVTNSIPSRFFQIGKKNTHPDNNRNSTQVVAKRHMSTQTTGLGSSKGKGNSSAGVFLTGFSSASSNASNSARNKLHQGINSPAYSHENIITVARDGANLVRTFKSRVGGGRAVRESHLPLSRPPKKPPTPEVRGWKESENQESRERFNKGRMGTGKGSKKAFFRGNPQVYEKRMEELARGLLDAANITL